MIRVTGGTRQQKEIVIAVGEWFIKHFGLYNAECYFRLKDYVNCWGECEEGRMPNTYRIFVAKNQSIRDFAATVVHELVHVKQWETGRWSGDGEREANRLQFTITDKLWKGGII